MRKIFACGQGGDDLREGKPTLPLIRVLEVGTDLQKQLVRQAIEHGEADFDAVAQAIRDTGALEHAQQCAVAEADMACKALEAFPASVAREALLNFCAFAVGRDR